MGGEASKSTQTTEDDKSNTEESCIVNKKPIYTGKNAVVFLWRPYLGIYRAKRSGHISLLLPDDTYISFWPDLDTYKYKVNKVLMGVNCSSKTFEEDVLLEGGEPDDKIEIPAEFIDIAKMKTVWEKTLEANYYSFLCVNCATVIKQVLIAGCKFYISLLYAADPAYVFRQIKSGLTWAQS